MDGVGDARLSDSCAPPGLPLLRETKSVSCAASIARTVPSHWDRNRVPSLLSHRDQNRVSSFPSHRDRNRVPSLPSHLRYPQRAVQGCLAVPPQHLPAGCPAPKEHTSVLTTVTFLGNSLRDSRCDFLDEIPDWFAGNIFYGGGAQGSRDRAGLGRWTLTQRPGLSVRSLRVP